MNKILLFLALCSPVLALTCPAGFIEVRDTLYGSVGGQLYAGTLAITMTVNTTAAGLTIRGQQRNIQVVSGGFDICMAPGQYEVKQTATSSSVTIPSSWSVPATGGPYVIPDIESTAAVSPGTFLLASQILFALKGLTDGQLAFMNDRHILQITN